jgi:hypothetical protein
MQNLIDVLNVYDSITLKEMEAEMLMQRFDLKFKFQINQLPFFLEKVASNYHVLEVGNNRLHKYESLYFDSEKFLLYQQHQNVRRNRYKVRYRRYADSDLTFFEIKLKTNKNITFKERILQDNIEYLINDDTGKFISEKTKMDPKIFSPKLWVYYSRITLVNKNADERITIDISTVFKMVGNTASLSFPPLVVAEIKQSKYFRSPFIAVMRENHIRESDISKYCMGIALMQENIKKNNFKHTILSINKLCHEQN